MGTPFGQYELGRRLGSGGMAETFLAVRRGPGGFEQRVCVKRILPAFESDPDLVRQFMEEARLAAQLRHANIIQVVDFGVVAGQHYLALELVDGMDLRSLLMELRGRGLSLDPRVAVFLATELAAALDFAHTPERGRLPVIHRDVSPSNVLVSRSGEVYLIDFGIARALGVKQRTHSGVVRGKIPYMAAEYALRATFDARSDLFALGVLLYESLAGERPYEGITDLDTLERIKAGVHKPLASLCPAAHPSFIAIIEQLLRPDPNERFPSAAALLTALSAIASPPTIARELGELVRTYTEPLVDPFAATGTLDMPDAGRTTLDLPGISIPPSFPSVIESMSDTPTRTSDASPRPSTPASMPWASTDPSQVSHHDRPSPLLAHQSQPSFQPLIPATLTSMPAAPAPRRFPWVLLAIGGVLAFIATGAGAYFLVELLRP
jgi:serine/threonine protein kinase